MPKKPWLSLEIYTHLFGDQPRPDTAIRVPAESYLAKSIPKPCKTPKPFVTTSHLQVCPITLPLVQPYTARHIYAAQNHYNTAIPCMP